MGIVVLLSIFFVKCLLAEEEEKSGDQSMNELNPQFPENNTLFSDSNDTVAENALLKIQFLPQPVESFSNGNSNESKVIKHLQEMEALKLEATSTNSSISNENLSSKLHRFIRSPKKGCKIPENLKESRLDCVLYPSRVSCKQTCIFGYTMKDGVKREMKCKYSDDEWKPVAEFEKCKPYVDCGLTLGPGGKYKCFTNYMNKAPNCEISCSKYEDKPAVPKKEYECDIKGKWTPKLPFCAKPGSGVKTVPPPKKKNNPYKSEYVDLDEDQGSEEYDEY